VSVLIAILLPALGAARRSAERAADLSDLRQHAAVITLYCNDHADGFPNFIDPEAGVGPLPGSDRDALGYFDQGMFWPIPLLERYYSADSLSDAFYLSQSEARLEGDTFGDLPSYILGSVFIAEPAYWRPESRRPPPDQLATMRLSQLRTPASKALLDAVPIHHTGDPAAARVRVGFTDGSASIVPRRDLIAGYTTGPGTFSPWADGPYPLTASAYTINGVHGRDIQTR
jgi:hypothetical protein